jgi:drug/metabolite transporter (DMT)-like permease
LTRAFQLADAAVVIPMDFLRLPLIAAVGFLFYGEALNMWVFFGALIVFAATWLNLKSASNAGQARAGTKAQVTS